MSYFVYIIKSLKDNKFYIGQTNNLTNRLLRHNNGEVVATRNRKPFILVYKENYENRVEAMKREKYLKSLKGNLERKLNIKFKQ
jgi:putative endonuclease